MILGIQTELTLSRRESEVLKNFYDTLRRLPYVVNFNDLLETISLEEDFDCENEIIIAVRG